MDKYTNYFKIRAFTLAEVLITLMVIGVLAVITIPSILQSWEERANVTQLRKTYSIMQQAFKLSEIYNGKLGTTTFSPQGGVAKLFMPYLKVIQDCQGTTEGCFSFADYTNPKKVALHTSTQPYKNYFYKFLLVDGSAVAIWNNTNSCNMSNANVQGKINCAWMYIDVNGPTPPNIMGKDLFGFSVNPDGIFPWGGPTTYIDRFSHDNNCKNASNDVYMESSFGCTKWVLERGNMKYLKEITPWE